MIFYRFPQPFVKIPRFFAFFDLRLELVLGQSLSECRQKLFLGQHKPRFFGKRKGKLTITKKRSIILPLIHIRHKFGETSSPITDLASEEFETGVVKRSGKT